MRIERLDGGHVGRGYLSVDDLGEQETAAPVRASLRAPLWTMSLEQDVRLRSAEGTVWTVQIREITNLNGKLATANVLLG